MCMKNFLSSLSLRIFCSVSMCVYSSAFAKKKIRIIVEEEEWEITTTKSNILNRRFKQHAYQFIMLLFSFIINTNMDLFGFNEKKKKQKFSQIAWSNTKQQKSEKRSVDFMGFYSSKSNELHLNFADFFVWSFWF